MTRQKSQQAYSQRILVNITRDMTAVTPKIIWAHEKPLLEIVFDEGNVKEVEAGALDEGYSGKVTPELLPYNKKQDAILPPSQTNGLGFLFIGDAASEYQRLADVYGKHPSENILIVEKIFGRFQDGRFERLLPTPELADLPKAQLEGLLRSYGVEIPADADLVKLAEASGIALG